MIGDTAPVEPPVSWPLPRDAQRARVYRAESRIPSSPLPGLPACGSFLDRVVGSFWWHQRFPERALAGSPRLRPGQGARRAFFREESTGPTITLPRRYRTKGVVLHELAHWALGFDTAFQLHGSTFTRLLVDLTAEFCGPEPAALLAAAYEQERVRVGAPARPGPDGRLHYGFDEALRLAAGRPLVLLTHATGGSVPVVGVVEQRRGATVRVRSDHALHQVALATVYAVRDATPGPGPGPNGPD